MADFGKPTYTRADVKLHGKEYEEEWVYYYTRGIPLLNQNTWTCNFFLNDGIVAEVDVL
ncbi:MAG: hypothetical protein K8I00_12935 [Candidatus Omnitrophica bacterium]|nr:hypothetical protein [Candidatus Omnitrophota bacterium]